MDRKLLRLDFDRALRSGSVSWQRSWRLRLANGTFKEVHSTRQQRLGGQNSISCAWECQLLTFFDGGLEDLQTFLD